MYNNINEIFGFDESDNRDWMAEDGCLGLCEHEATDPLPMELAALQKRVKKTHPLATFRRTAVNTIAILVDPKSLCFDAIVSWVADAYVIQTVSTERSRSIAYKDRENYEVKYSSQQYTSITSKLARATKLVKDTDSVTAEGVVKEVMVKTVSTFSTGLSKAKEKLDTLQVRVFTPMTTLERTECLLEYCLADKEQRPVRADIKRRVDDCTDKYLLDKSELGHSITACQGLCVLSIYKVANVDKIFYYYADGGTELWLQHKNTKYVNDVNDFPQEVLRKLSVLQTTGVDAMESLGYGTAKVLTSVGAVWPSSSQIPFIEDAMCVYVSPEAIAEVATLD